MQYFCIKINKLIEYSIVFYCNFFTDSGKFDDELVVAENKKLIGKFIIYDVNYNNKLNEILIYEEESFGHKINTFSYEKYWDLASYINDADYNSYFNDTKYVKNRSNADIAFSGLRCANDPDGDGIGGPIDTCVNTMDPYNLDHDYDGVGDVCDLCSATPGGDIADANGCSLEQLKNVDNDGDGYTENQGDCNDNNPAMHPNTIWYRDADGDGYSDGTTITQCQRGLYYYLASELNSLQIDCNDNNSAIHPDAVEVCGNNIDDNCDGQVDEGCNVHDPQLHLVLEDDFNDGVINPIWLPHGNDVIESNGLLSIQQNVTDKYANIDHNFDQPLSQIRIEMRHYMHASNNYFFPSVIFYENIATGGKGFGLSWMKSGYSPDNCNISANYNKVIVKADGVSCYASDLISSDYYDKWITSYISYDLTTGKLDYDLGGDGTIDFSVTLPEEHRISVLGTLRISGYGWWTGHRHDIDWIRVYRNEIPVDVLNVDNDGDGYTENQGDCDDNNSAVHPTAPELCNDIDDNCEGQVDEGCSVDTPQILSKTTLPVCFWSQPAIGDDGRLYVMADSTCNWGTTGIAAIDLSSTPSIAWGPVVPPGCAAFSAVPSISDNGLVYGTGDWLSCGDGPLVAYNATDGSLAWKKATWEGYSPHPRHIPAIDDSRNSVYFGSSSIFSVDGQSGGTNWRRQGGYYIGSGGIVIDSQGNIYQAAGSNLYSYDPTGGFRWSKNTPYAYPYFGVVGVGKDNTLLVRAHGSHDKLIGFAPNGNELWTAPEMGGNVVVDEQGNIYGSSQIQPTVCSLSLNGVLRWKTTLPGSGLGTVGFVDASGNLYVTKEDKVYCLAGNNGTILWSFVADATITSYVALGPGGRILFADIAKHLYLLDTALSYAQSSWPYIGGNRRNTMKAMDTLVMPGL